MIDPQLLMRAFLVGGSIISRGHGHGRERRDLAAANR